MVIAMEAVYPAKELGLCFVILEKLTMNITSLRHIYSLRQSPTYYLYAIALPFMSTKFLNDHPFKY